MNATGVADILVRIVAQRRARIATEGGLGEPDPAPGSPAVLVPATNPFLSALAARRGGAIIAEIKMGSPSLGSLAGRFDPERQAAEYARHGAAALSVVVEPDFFFGSYELLRRCREASGLPSIAKEFVVDLVQLDRAREAGASAVLLIAALQDGPTLGAWAAAARERGLAPLVEVHGRGELERLGAGPWELVGVNNRDLRRFTVDFAHGEGLEPLLPAGAIKVAESGIRRRSDLVRLRDAGYDAFLVGEALVTSESPGRVLEELLG